MQSIGDRAWEKGQLQGEKILSYWYHVEALIVEIGMQYELNSFYSPGKKVQLGG